MGDAPSRNHPGNYLVGWSRDAKRAYVAKLKANIKGTDGQSWLDYLTSITGSDLYKDYVKYAKQDPRDTFTEAKQKSQAKQQGKREAYRASKAQRMPKPADEPSPPQQEEKKPRNVSKEAERLKKLLRDTEHDHAGWLRNFKDDPELADAYAARYGEPADDPRRRERLAQLHRSLREPGAEGMLVALKQSEEQTELRAEYRSIYKETPEETARTSVEPVNTGDIQRALAKAAGFGDVPGKFTAEELEEIWNDSTKRNAFYSVLRALRITHRDLVRHYLEENSGKKGVKEYFEKNLKLRRARSNADGNTKLPHDFTVPPERREIYTHIVGSKKHWERFVSKGEFMDWAAYETRTVKKTDAVYLIAKHHKLDPGLVWALYHGDRVRPNMIGSTDIRQVCLATLESLSDDDIVKVASGDSPNDVQFRISLRYWARRSGTKHLSKLEKLDKKYPKDVNRST